MSPNSSLKAIRKFLRMESFVGILLMLVCFVALILANSPWKQHYFSFFSQSVPLGVGKLQLTKTLLHWINDGLMAIFFMSIGLELKREMCEGELSKPSQVILPGFAALGGVVLPVLIYFIFNYSHVQNYPGWAIPAATDIAFALGVLSLLGKRVPISLKIFLLTLAIFDDLIAIIIIACFYTTELSILSLGLAMAAIAVLVLMNYFNIKKLFLYLIVGFFLWLFVLESGVHATLAGVILAFCIPHRLKGQSTISPLKTTEQALHSWVLYLILPLFALANAGVDVSAITVAHLRDPLLWGVMGGLFIGKQLGIFAFSFCLIKSGLAPMPKAASWGQLYGVAILGGIGFTMSLFIASLAFEEVRETGRLGILLGSLLSAFVGYFFLKLSSRTN